MVVKLTKLDKRKNIKIIFFSDTHLGIDYPLRKTSKPHRGEDYFNNFFKVLDRAKEINADLIIHGGDIFDTEIVNQRIIDRCYDAFYEVADMGIPIIIIPGNHDKKGLPSSLFVEHPNLHFINNASNISFNLNGKTIEIHAIPYIRKVGNSIENEILSLINNSKKTDNTNNIDRYKILLMHQSLEGSKVGPVDFTFKNTEDTVGQNQIPGYYDMVLSGHIHRHQIIDLQVSENKTTPFIYCGSTERTSFSEIKEEKGFVILEFKRKTPFLQPVIKFEKLSTRPMHDLILKGLFNDEKTLISQLSKSASNIGNNSVVRIVCDSDETKLKLTPKLLKICFNDGAIVSVKGISALYRTPKYK